VSPRAVGSVAFCLLLLVGPALLAAQDSSWRLLPEPTDRALVVPGRTASWTPAYPAYRLLPPESRDHEQWGSATPLTSPSEAFSVPAADATSRTQPCPTPRLLSPDSGECEKRLTLAELTGSASPRLTQPEAEVPRWEFLERHRTLFSTLVPIVSVGAVTANALVGYERHGFEIHKEGWFGRDTVNGGADKAGHLADYYVITHLFEDVYRMLGHSERSAILWGLGIAVATGLGNEISDGFTRHGFSWEDLTMDVAGAATASLVSATRTKDLFSIRTSHLPHDTYTHDVYSADLKLSGVGQRLGVNLGPLRWLLFSVTYGSKGYRVQPPEEKQRLVGLEIGLNLQQILFDVGVKKNTWWGYALHLVADNIRFPYTAVGVRLDMNSGKWHGPNSGNYD
jgi:uncharacterized protein YfiM (DUF2279 family)